MFWSLTFSRYLNGQSQEVIIFPNAFYHKLLSIQVDRKSEVVLEMEMERVSIMFWPLTFSHVILMDKVNK